MRPALPHSDHGRGGSENVSGVKSVVPNADKAWPLGMGQPGLCLKKHGACTWGLDKGTVCGCAHVPAQGLWVHRVSPCVVCPPSRGSDTLPSCDL